MLTGERPFVGDGVEALFAAILLASQTAPPDPAPKASPTARVHGRLIVNGEPMSGNRVTLWHTPWVGIPPQTVTGADGSFDLGWVPAGESWLMIATADGTATFTRTERFNLAADEDRNVEVPREAGSIRGTLTGALGDTSQLLVHLACDVKSDVGDVGRLHVPTPGRSAKPDANGSFSIGPLVTGRYTLDVERHVGGLHVGEFLTDHATSIVVTKGDPTSIEPLELHPEVEVSGRFELPADAHLVELIARHGVWFARPYGASRTGDTAHLAPDHSFSLRLVPATYELGSLGIDDDPHAEADPLVVPGEGLSNVVIQLRKSGGEARAAPDRRAPRSYFAARRRDRSFFRISRRTCDHGFPRVG